MLENRYNKYIDKMGISNDKPLILIGFDSCNICYSTFKPYSDSLRSLNINIVLVSNDKRRSVSFTEGNYKNYYVDDKYLAVDHLLYNSVAILYRYENNSLDSVTFYNFETLKNILSK